MNRLGMQRVDGLDRKARRRRQILLIARDVFAEKGYVAATVDDIASRVPVARGTFYLYFDDKLDVFQALVDGFFERIATSIKSIDLEDPGRSPRAQLRQNIERVVALALDDPGMVKIGFSTVMGVDAGLDEKLRGFYGALRQFMDESLATGQAIGLVREGDRRLMLAMALGGLKELLLDAVGGDIPRKQDELVAAVMDFLEGGLLSHRSS